MTTYNHLTDVQAIAVLCVGYFSMSLSLMGSCSIMYIQLKTGKWRKDIYHRLVCGLTIMDLIVTPAMILTPFAVPAETNTYFARGTFTTCEVLAFFYQLYLGAAMYNSFLALYYMLVITYGKTHAAIQRLLEPWVHIVCVVVPMCFNVFALLNEELNPTLLLNICSLYPYPADCIFVEEVECERGSPNSLLRILYLALYLVFAFCGIGFTVRVFFSVRNQTRVHIRHSHHGALEPSQKRRIRAVGLQAALYCAAFLNGFWAVLASAILTATYTANLESSDDLRDRPGVFAMNLVMWFFWPMQGFLNCLVYTRPRLVRWKDANQDKSWWWAFQKVVSGEPAPTTARTAHLRHGSLMAPVSSVSQRSSKRSSLPNTIGSEAVKKDELQHQASVDSADSIDLTNFNQEEPVSNDIAERTDDG